MSYRPNCPTHGVRVATAMRYGENLPSDPEGCVRGAFPNWYTSETSCQQGLPADMQCNPRYANGVWTYFTPYARDSASCGGQLPPDILPQVLTEPSLAQGDCWYQMEDMTLTLMMNGNIAEFSFTLLLDDGPVRQTLVFRQSDLLQDELYSPLLARYTIPLPNATQGERAQLEINLTNGYVTIMLPMGSGPCVVQYVMTNVLPIQTTSAAAAMQARQMRFARR